MAEAVHTPEDMRRNVETWPVDYKYVVDEDTAILFAYPHPTVLWAGAALIRHIPSMSSVIFDHRGRVQSTRYESEEARVRLEAILDNRAWQARI